MLAPERQEHYPHDKRMDLYVCLATDIALHPNTWNVFDLQALHVASTRTTLLAVNGLADAGWIKKHSVSEGSVMKRNVFSTTEQLWTQFHDTVQRSSELLLQDQWLFNDAVTQRRVAGLIESESAEAARERYSALSVFIGHTSILGQIHDLSREAAWFGGVSGWQALVTIKALHDQA